MILGVDVGGTKTLIGAFTQTGDLKESIKFPTPNNYSDFVRIFQENYSKLECQNYETATVAVPALLDRKKGLAIEFGNLSWKNVPIRKDLEKIIKTNTYIENDAKLAALAESCLLKKPIPEKVLYITISTGIGIGLIYKGRLSDSMLDSEAGHMILPNDDGELLTWETFASGKAIKNKYGKLASEIDDTETWTKISKNIAIGVVELCAVIEPDLIIIGGGVGTHFIKYGDILIEQVKNMLPDIIRMPKIIGAKNAEQAALRGCYEYSLFKKKLNKC